MISWVSKVLEEAVNGVWTSVSGALGSLWSQISAAFQAAVLNLYTYVQTVWLKLSSAISGLGNTLGGAITSGLQTLGQGLGSLGSSIVSFVTRVANDINAGIGAVGQAVGGAVNQIGTWIADALKGVGTAMGSALQEFGSWLWKQLQTAGSAIVGFLSQDVVAPLMGALNWIRDAIFSILSGMWNSIEAFFSHHSPVTPEEAANYTVPLLLIGAGAGFGVSVMGAVGSVKALGTGVEARAVSDFLESAFALADISKSLITPIIDAAYGRPVRYYYNAMFRPEILSTRTADEMYWHGQLSEPDWRQVYAYHGWKDQDIDGWFKTFHANPAQRTLLTMLDDPEIPEAWIRDKLHELAFTPDDIEVLIGYRRYLSHAKDLTALDPEKNRLKDNAIADYIKGYISEQDLRSTLETLDYAADVVNYYVQDAVQDRERKRKDLLVTEYLDAYAKGLIATEDELTGYLGEVLVDSALVTIMVDTAYVKRYHKPKAA